jgi:hypothetical protein
VSGEWHIRDPRANIAAAFPRRFECVVGDSGPGPSAARELRTDGSHPADDGTL